MNTPKLSFGDKAIYRSNNSDIIRQVKDMAQNTEGIEPVIIGTDPDRDDFQIGICTGDTAKIVKFNSLNSDLDRIRANLQFMKDAPVIDLDA